MRAGGSIVIHHVLRVEAIGLPALISADCSICFENGEADWPWPRTRSPNARGEIRKDGKYSPV